MAKKRSFKKKSGFKRKSTTSRSSKRARRSVVKPKLRVSTGIGFPKRMTMTHKYCETVQTGLSSTTGSLVTYVFSCNGMFDPNITGTGHQPMYFDQMANLYNHYHVIGSKITIKVVPETVSANSSRVTGFINDNTTITPTTVDTVCEQTQGKNMFIFPPGDGTVRTISMKWSAKKMFGGSVLANNALQGNSAANPTEQSYFVLAIQADDGATIGYNMVVMIEYIAVWKELIDLAPS